MSYQTIAEYGGMDKGLHVLFLYVNSVSNGIFMPMMLFSLYLIVLLGMYFAQKNSTGYGDFPQSMAVAGFLVTVVAGLLRLIVSEGGAVLVSLPTLAVCMVVMLIGFAVLFLSKDTY